jgi:anti-anti-sigma factor
MNVSVANDGGHTVVRLDGRLDAESADHLSETFSDLLRGGARSVIVDLSHVSYASSAAATVLARRGEDFAALRGQLLLVSPSPAVSNLLSHAGLGSRILRASQERSRSSGEQAAYDLDTTQEWHTPRSQKGLESLHGRYEVSAFHRGAALTCRAHGVPSRLVHGVGAADCDVVTFHGRAFGLGIGAIGGDYESCRPRFGELVAAAGIVAYMPTDGAHVADYLVGVAECAATAVVAQALVFEGDFSHLARFAASDDAAGVTLTDMGELLLDAVGADMMGLVMVAESAGLVGAYLRRSPAASDDTPSFRLPAVRSWLTLSGEPVHATATVLVVGVVARQAGAPLAAHLRPMSSDGRVQGHFHAAAFPYTPVPQRTMEAAAVVANLFEHQRVRGVLHLLQDDRAGLGRGESAFRRGLIWAAPISSVS